MTTRIDKATLMALSNRALARAGLSPEHAETTSQVLVQGDMMGIPTHGVIRLTPYTERLKHGGVNPKAIPKIDQRAPSLCIVDGQNALGPVVANAALCQAIEMVKETGIAYVGCRSSNHLGAMVPYALQACQSGFVMLSGTSASTTMPPWGGAEARIGNNPMCFAAACPKEPHIILDMAMSVAARGKIRGAQAAGQAIPEGWAVDKTGKPTTDASEALEGFLVAVGGHKGSGLSMAIDVLSGVLSGAKFLTGITSWVGNNDTAQELGHFFILIDPARLIGKENYEAAMNEFCEIVHTTPAADPATPVILPGEREQTRIADALAHGIELNVKVLEDVRRLAGEID